MSFRYTDPGDGRLFTEDVKKVLCKHISRTGVGFCCDDYAEPMSLKIPELAVSALSESEVKEIWLNFDAYLTGYNGDYGGTSVGITFVSDDCQSEVQINASEQTSAYEVLWGSADNERESVEYDFTGFHIFKLHIISDSTNGLIELYAHDNTTPIYTYTGNVNQGKRITSITLYTYNWWAVVSNIIVSDSETSLAEVVPYSQKNFKFENSGTKEGWPVDIDADVVESDEYSHTGTALEFHYCYDLGIPVMDDMWMKFDFSRLSEDGGYCWMCVQFLYVYYGLYVDYDGLIYSSGDGYDGWDDNKGSLPVGNIHTCILHVATAPVFTVEVWIDNDKIIEEVWKSTGDIPRNYYFLNDYGDNATLISNITISNNESDVRNTLPDGYIKRQYDMKYEVKRTDNTSHSDIRDTIIDSTNLWYKDAGLPDNGVMVLGNIVSNSGVGMYNGRTNFWEQDIKATKELWVKFDVFAWDEVTLETPDIDISFKSKDSVYYRVQVDFGKNNKNANVGISIIGNTTLSKYNANSLIGLHTIKLHILANSTNGLIECFLDNNSSAVCSFNGNVDVGDGISLVKIMGAYVGDYTIVSNIIIGESEPSINEIVPYNGNTCVIYKNNGLIEELSKKVYKVFSQWQLYQVTPTGVTIHTDTKSRTGVGFYQTELVPCFGIPRVDEMWLRFDLYHHGETPFYCLTNPRVSASIVFGTAKRPSANLGLRLKEGTTNQVEVVVESFVCTTINIVPDTIQTYLLHFKAGATETELQLWIDDQQVFHAMIDRGVGFFNDVCLASANEDNLFSNIAVSNDRAMLDASNVECHADIVREVTANSSTPEVWRYESYGLAKDFSGTLIDISDDNVSRTGVAVATEDAESSGDGMTYSLYKKAPIYGKSEGEAWLKFDACTISDDAYLWFGFGDGDACGAGCFAIDWHKGDSTTCVLRTHNDDITDERSISRDVIHTFRLHVQRIEGQALYEVYIDNDSIPSYQYQDSADEYDVFRNVEWQINGVAISNVIISNAEISASDTLPRYVPPQPSVWRYENPGVIDGKLGTDSDTQYWNDEQLLEVHNNTISRTGTAIMQKDPDSYPHLYYILPDEMKGASELWFKFDWCICSHGGYEFPYLWHGVFNLDINGAGDMRVLTSEGEIALVPDGRNVDARMAFDGRTWQETTISFDVHSMMFHYIFGDPDGIIEIYLDDDNTPIHIERDRTFNYGYVSIEVADIAISNIIISNVKPSFSEVVGQSENPPQPQPEPQLNTEGIATHKTIDLGSEMTVGIGIAIDGEGYAMIRTAKEDSRYTEWENYVPCERLCRYIDVRLHVLGIITSAMLTIDKRTVSKTISKHLTAGENVVNYDEAFYNVPAVIPTAIGNGVVAHVISKDKTSCVIKITDGNNNAVEGDVDILIRGW